MKKNLDTVIMVTLFVLFLSVVVLMSPGQKSLTGAVTSQTTQSRVELIAYYAIALSNNLSEGIDFGTISTIPSTDINALANYDPSNQTRYSLIVSNDSNAQVDFCIRATNMTNSGGDTLPLSGYTWQDNLIPYNNNLTDPFGPGGSIAMSESWIASNENVTPGNSSYYRFWLDIPGGQPVGLYNNTVLFKGKISGTC